MSNSAQEGDVGAYPPAKSELRYTFLWIINEGKATQKELKILVKISIIFSFKII